MLIYETEGFLEVEAKHIQQLCRSTTSVTLDDTERESSAVHAVLCDSLDNSKPRCCVVFHFRALKKAFVFAVKGSENQSPWQSGQDLLTQMGFQLEDVNLKLSPAMLEVVLRDVNGLLTPAEARKQRAEKASVLAEFQKAYDKDPDSSRGKKAALKLNAEKRLNVQAEELRQALEALFASKEKASVEFEALVGQMKDLTSRLEAAEARAESERNQREMSESITSAAEKRIQELEEVLVDVETTSSKALKQRQKVVKLQGRVKELDEKLKAAENEVKNEGEKQEKFIADVNAAHEQMSVLENELQETTATLVNIQAQLVEEQAEKAQLKESFLEAELRIKALDAELKNAEKKEAQHAESARESEKTQTQLHEVELALKDALGLNRTLEETLATADEKNEELMENLQLAEKSADDKTRQEARLSDLTEQNEQLSGELKALRDEYDQERSIRKRLEKDAVAEDKRLQELEDSLAKMSTNTSATAVAEELDDSEIASLKVERQQLQQQIKTEQQSRETLEFEAGETHKLIDSLEKMIRETEETATERRSRELPKEGESQKLCELGEQLKAVENQLEQELAEQQRLVKAVAVAEKKILEQEDLLKQGQAEELERRTKDSVNTSTVTQRADKSGKPLPHELRPAPKQGALFHPDWNLEGLPCKSSDQIVKAWETVFNVQTKLEGYPSQYCMAFLVVLRLGKQKKLYMLYRLKLDKHTLVCVPAKTPEDETSLKKTINEALNFLKMSGFEMDEMAAENVDSTLSPYFLEH